MRQAAAKFEFSDLETFTSLAPASLLARLPAFITWLPSLQAPFGINPISTKLHVVITRLCVIKSVYA
jgi:hypothetical protein